MLSKAQIEERIKALGGDAVHFRGAGGTWEVILKPPQLKDWDFYLANRESPEAKPSALLILVRSMLAYAGDPIEGETTPGATFDRLRTRWVSMVEAIGKQRRFDVFVGLVMEQEEKE